MNSWLLRSPQSLHLAAHSGRDDRSVSGDSALREARTSGVSGYFFRDLESQRKGGPAALAVDARCCSVAHGMEEVLELEAERLGAREAYFVEGQAR